MVSVIDSVEIDRTVYSGGRRRVTAVRLNGMVLRGVRSAVVTNSVDELEVVTLEMYADVDFIDVPYEGRNLK